MRNTHRLLPFLVFFTLSCGLVVPVSPPTPLPPTATQTSSPTTTATITPDISATQTIVVALKELSYTATPTATMVPEIQPEDLLESEQPLPPPAVSPGTAYQLADEVLIGGYGLRFWHDTNDAMGFSNVLMIESSNASSIRIDQVSAIHPLTGTDINGDNFPEAIIETYSGGAHCCFGTQVYRLGTQPKLLLKKPESNTGGQFEDIDGDGVQEFITYDDIFAYQYCAFAGSPTAKSILVYDPITEGYQPASPQFPEAYTADIQKFTEIAENVMPGDYGEWDETTKCGVLPMTLAYIYSGDIETARIELRRVYPYADYDSFWDGILLRIQNSPLYILTETE